MDNSIQDKLNILKIGYIKKLETLVPEFKNYIQNTDVAKIDEIYIKVHTISGTSGMYGLIELSEISSDFEVYLKDIKSDVSLYIESDFKERFCKYIDEIERTIKV